MDRVSSRISNLTSDFWENAVFLGLARYGLVLVYCLTLVKVYAILHQWWAYFGFTYLLNDTSIAYAACFVVALPAILLPARIFNLSQFAAYIIYLLVFIPSLLVPIMQLTAGFLHAQLLFTATLIGTTIFIIICRGQITPFRPFKIDPQIFWIGFLAIYGLSTVIVLVTFASVLSFAGINNADIYEQRAIGGEAGAGAASRYALLFLANALNPFLIAYGLKYNKALLALGILGQILVFSAVALRYVILLPLFIIGIYFLFGKIRSFSSLKLLGGIVLVVLTFFPLMFTYDPNDGFLGSFLSLLYMRTLLISGMAFGFYDTFFSMYPTTNFSHINIVQLFVDYPYGEYDVGQVVGLYMAPTTGAQVLNLNANFIASDAIASFGIWAIPPIAALAGFIIRMLARAIALGQERMACAAAMGFLISLSNTSMFTALLSGGGALLVLLFYLAPKDEQTVF